jgi:hypothetical protein
VPREVWKDPVDAQVAQRQRAVGRRSQAGGAPETCGSGRSMALAKADQKLQLQQQEINALEKQVQSLSEQKEHTIIKKARQQSLSQLKTRAETLLHEVKEREAAKRPKASSTKVLLHSVSALTKDMKAVDSKVDHLASLVEKKKSDDVFGQEVRFAEPCACAAARVAPGGQATVVCELFCRRPVEACPPCGLLTRARCDRCCAVWSVPASNASECLAVNASPTTIGQRNARSQGRTRDQEPFILLYRLGVKLVARESGLG